MLARVVKKEIRSNIFIVLARCGVVAASSCQKVFSLGVVAVVVINTCTSGCVCNQLTIVVDSQEEKRRMKKDIERRRMEAAERVKNMSSADEDEMFSPLSPKASTQKVKVPAAPCRRLGCETFISDEPSGKELTVARDGIKTPSPVKTEVNSWLSAAPLCLEVPLKFTNDFQTANGSNYQQKYKFILY